MSAPSAWDFTGESILASSGRPPRVLGGSSLLLLPVLYEPALVKKVFVLMASVVPQYAKK